MKITISDKICGKQNLIFHIENILTAPYKDDNWDGLRDCLQDLSWINDTSVEIWHDSLPTLNSQELLTYLDILYETEITWRKNDTVEFSVIYPVDQMDYISSLIQYNNLILFNRLIGQQLRRIIFVYEEDKKLLEVYFLFDGFCFSIDNHLKVDYYPLTIFQMEHSIEYCSKIHKVNNIDLNFVDMFNEITNWSLIDCKVDTNDKRNPNCQVRFRNTVICIAQIECYLDSNRRFCCVLNYKK